MNTCDAQYRGVYTIPVTPFDESGSVGWDSLRRCVEFCVEAGGHGIVMPVNASEFFTLTDAERDEAVRVGVRTVGGAVPFVAGTTGVSPQHAMERSLRAQDAGADALVILPPPRISRADHIEEYYRIVGEAVSIPVFLQNHFPPAGTLIPIDVMIRLLREVPSIQYVKEEAMPPGPSITAVLAQAGDVCKGVMGGMGSRYLLDEYRRGGCGTMPGCHITDAHVALWEALERGGRDADGNPAVSEEAREIWEQMLPCFTFESLYGGSVYKTVLHRRGVIETPIMRIPARRPPMDRFDLIELDIILDRLSPLLTWKRS